MPSALRVGVFTTHSEADRVAVQRFGSPAAMRMKAVATILRVQGIAPTDANALYAEGDDPALDCVVRHLRRHGLAPRSIEVTANELGSLRLPTLVQMRSGAVVPVLRVTRKRLTIVGDDGRRLTLSRPRFVLGMTGFALDLCPALPPKGAFVRRVLGLLLQHRRLIARMALLSGLGALISLVGPVVSRLVLDRAVPNNDSGLLGAAVLGTLAIGVHQSWLSWLRTRVAMALGANVDSAVQPKLFEHSLRISFSEAQKRPVGSSIAVLGAGAGVTELFISGVFMPLADFASAAAYLVMLAWTLPKLALLAFGAMTLCAAALVYLGRRLIGLEFEAMRAGAKQRSRLLEILAGILTLKSLGAESRALQLWLPHFSEQRRLAIERGKTEVWLQLWLNLSEKAVTVGLVALGGAACLEGKLSLGDFMASSMLATGFVSGCAAVLGNILPLFAAGVGFRAVDGLLALPTRGAGPSAAARDEDEPATEGEHAIVLRNVWFRYSPDGPWILKNYDLRVAAGADYALTGPSGSGKTTILRLIAGLLEPTRGSVRVFGQNPTDTLGSSAYLPQEPLLFSGSILSNLRILSGADEQSLARAVDSTGLRQLVASLPMKFETVMTPGGTNLSGGQRQLVLLTAAVASQQRVLLLDESVAHLDRVTRAELSARGLFSGKTVVSVVHDA